ncbi:MAG TPA: GNAT family N-acetyltransferase [Micromonosporaceae bacterium]|nr:GNAT family N-acetyltransferase [Micromonosporaceae bacterium]
MAQGYIRPARPGEAGEIARIQLETWRVAYRRILPRHVLDQLDADWMAQRWRAAVEHPPSDRHRVLVAVEQAEQAYLVGFAAAGPADEAALAPGESLAVDAPPDESLAGGGPPDESLIRSGAPDGWGDRVAAVTDLLVEPRWGRRGHGSRLLAACVAHWVADGFERAVAWAFRDDVATRKFLTSAGWAPDGAARALDVADLLVPQLRLHVRVGDNARMGDPEGPEPGP